MKEKNKYINPRDHRFYSLITDEARSGLDELHNMRKLLLEEMDTHIRRKAFNAEMIALKHASVNQILIDSYAVIIGKITTQIDSIIKKNMEIWYDKNDKAWKK